MRDALLDDTSREVFTRLKHELGGQYASNIVAFAGAGLSAQAGLPLWQQLIKDLGTASRLSEQERGGIDVVNRYDPLWHAEELLWRLATQQISISGKGDMLPDDLLADRPSPAHVEPRGERFGTHHLLLIAGMNSI